MLSHIIIDDLRAADGREQRGLLGGAGTYAVAGMRLVAERVGISCGVGEDFDALHGRWFRANGIDTAGLEIRGAHTPRSWVVYQREDARTETPQFGAAHFNAMAPRLADLPLSYRQARGLYAFCDDDERFWNSLLELRAASGATVLWELHEAAARPDRWRQVARILRRVDIVSLNRAEGRALCGSDEPADVLGRLLQTGVGAVALRLGGAGALVATTASGWRIPAYPAPFHDPTGAGNAFSGALLAEWAGGEDVRIAACGAAAAASFMIEQHGPPGDLLALQPEWQRRRDWLRGHAAVLH